MKKLITILALGLTLISCKKEDVKPNNTTPIESADTLKVVFSNPFNDQENWMYFSYTDNTNDYKYEESTFVDVYKRALTDDIDRSKPITISGGGNYCENCIQYEYYVYINDSLIYSCYTNGEMAYTFTF